MEEQAESSTLPGCLAGAADPQLSSPFFSVLPPEVRRMIYTEVWRHNQSHSDVRDHTGEKGLKQHIVELQYGGHTHSPCVVSDQTAPDTRSQGLAASQQQTPPTEIWINRIESAWGIHWPCEELYRRRTSRQWSPFLAVLLTCRLVYLESKETLYSAVTFVFTNIATAHSFIFRFSPDTFRSIELSVHVSLALRELYVPAHISPPAPPVPPAHPFSRRSNPWNTLCGTLAWCTGLGRLSIWCNLHHLGGWKGNVWERVLFADLWSVRVNAAAGAGVFVLALPDVEGDDDDDDDGEAEARRLELRQELGDDQDPEPAPQDYLVGTAALRGAPFRVLRAPRPDYWAAHMARLEARARQDQDMMVINAGPRLPG